MCIRDSSLGVPVNAIAEAVFARAISSHPQLRAAAQAALDGPDGTLSDLTDPAARQGFVDDVRDACLLYTSRCV